MKSAHTGRTELGQGLKTVLVNLISQGLGLDFDKITIVMGDSETCPDDGPTEGSSATRIVGWGYWHACQRIREHLVGRVAKKLNIKEKDLRYENAAIVGRRDTKIRVTLPELVDGVVQMTRLEPTKFGKSKLAYVDHRSSNVNGAAIVTGTLFD